LDVERYSKLDLLAKQSGTDLRSYITAVLERHIEERSSQSDLHNKTFTFRSSLSDLHNQQSEEKPSQSDLHLQESEVGSTAGTVGRGGGSDDGELVRRVESLERGLAEFRGALDALARELRGLQDSVNAYTGKTDQVLQRLSQVVETLEHVAEALRQQGPVAGGKASGSEETPGRGRRTDACEILEREGIVYESDIAGKIKNRDAFFAKLRRACGAVVLETAKERVAVRPDLWEEFRSKLTSLTTSDEGRISRELGEGGFRLFKALREGGIVYYDSTGRRWVVVGEGEEG
jgi:uncharacterized protein YukE